MRQDSKQNSQEAESILDKVAWDKSPLIPTITQDSKSKEVLMLGFSSRDSLALSLFNFNASVKIVDLYENYCVNILSRIQKDKSMAFR